MRFSVPILEGICNFQVNSIASRARCVRSRAFIMKNITIKPSGGHQNGRSIENEKKRSSSVSSEITGKPKSNARSNGEICGM